MKVILLRDVAKLGRRMDIVSVPDGYGMNKLVPQGMAEPATPANIKKVQTLAAKTESDREVSAAAFEGAVAKLKGKVVDVPAEASEEGKMYQALKSADIITAVDTAEGVKLGEDCIVIKSPIKQTGEHAIELVSGDIHGELTINVIAK